MNRLAERRGELIDRGRAVTFTWRGQAVEGLAGDTVASALYADGIRVFSRSFKYHRPRGLLCCGEARLVGIESRRVAQLYLEGARSGAGEDFRGQVDR